MIRALTGTLVGLAVLAANFTASAWHRMPEVYILVEALEVDDQPVAAITVRLEAEDALVMVAEKHGVNASLDDPAVQKDLLAAVGPDLTLSAGQPEPLGVEVDGDTVFAFFTGDASTTIMKAEVLSVAYDSWTNYVRDERDPGSESQMFTQRGPMVDHQH
ncbi:MAG: hypothetical protein HRU11_09965 [Parvularculaceae bacterium]|nr:hypothetical protein [Parvularculaceae bacterium]